jgi:putative ABC transport system ATP-binding protein
MLDGDGTGDTGRLQDNDGAGGGVSGIGGAPLPDVVVRDLVIAYSSGGYTARPIDGLSLDAHAGQLILLLGASGCGKTSLLSVLAGILTPTSGSVHVQGTEVTTLSPTELLRYRRDTVGVVFQSFNLVPSLSALENVMLPLLSAGEKRRVARDRARSLLLQMDLGDRLDHRPNGLSGGEQQRVAIARALAHEPRVLLADEPTAHLDYIQVESVIRLLRQLADEGRLVIVATHDERMIPLADRVVNLTARPELESRSPERLSLAPGEVVFRQGEPGELVYVVERGAITLLRERDDGSEERVAVVEPPRYFGELAPMFGLRRSATARASVGSTVVGYTLRDFRDRFRLNAPSDVLTGGTGLAGNAPDTHASPPGIDRP